MGRLYNRPVSLMENSYKSDINNTSYSTVVSSMMLFLIMPFEPPKSIGLNFSGDEREKSNMMLESIKIRSQSTYGFNGAF